MLEERRSESVYAGNTQERREDKPCSKLLEGSRMVKYYKSLCEVVERTSNHGDPHVSRRTLMKRNVDGVSPTILPVLLIYGEARLGEALVEVWRDVYLYAHLLWELRALRSLPEMRTRPS